MSREWRDYEEHSDKGRRPLALAAKDGNIDLVAMLLAGADVDVDVRDSIGRTPLALASKNGHAAVVAQLLAAGANPNLRDLKYVAPLWHAAKFGHVAVVRRLLTCGRLLDVNPRPLLLPMHKSETPLAVALKNGHRDTAELLATAKGIDPYAEAERDGGMISILERAVRGGYEDIALALLNKCDAMNVSVGLESSEGNFDEEGAESATRNAVELASRLLVFAADAGCYRIAQQLLNKHGADVNVICRYYGHDKECYKQSPLMAASRQGHKRIIRLLLDAEGIQPDLCADYEATALIQAAKKGLLDVVKMLLADARVTADQRDEDGRTALSYAAEHGEEAVVAELLANESVEPDSTDSQARTPLMWAISPGPSIKHDNSWRPDKVHQAIVRRLLACRRVNPNSRDKLGESPLILAAKCGSVDLVAAILEHPQTDKKAGRANTALAVAAYNDHADVVQVLLAKGQVDVNAVNDEYPEGTPLTLAAQSCHESGRAVRPLLSAPGIDPNGKDQYGKTPLHRAAWNGKVKVVKQLLAAAGIDPNGKDQDGDTPLQGAARSGKVKVVKQLLAAAGIDPIIQDQGGRTALHVAKSAEVIKALLKAPNINADLADNKGRTPLSLVAQAGEVEFLDILLAAKGVDPDSRDEAGRNPLSWVFDYDENEGLKIDDRKEALRQLVRIEAVDPNAEDAEGLTPLLRAIQYHRGSEFVGVLAKRKDLDVNKRGRDGLTPLALAKEKGDTVTIALLRARGAIAPDEDLLTIGTILPNDPALSNSSDYTGRHWLDESIAAEHPLRQKQQSPKRSFVRLRLFAELTSTVDREERNELAREYRLFLGEQQQYIGQWATENTASLCRVCSKIDLDAVFRTRHAECAGRYVASLGNIDDTWEERTCPLCRLIAAVLPRSRTDQDCILVSLSTTQSWLCQDRLELWRLFDDPWIDTMALGVMSLPDARRFMLSSDADKVFSAGFISRLGSNCPEGGNAVSVPQLAADRSDLRMSTARDWIKCCRDHHGEECNPRRLASVPHFRLIECTTRRIVKQDPKVGAPPPYVALSYVWGQAPQWEEQSLDDPISGTVAAVIEDAIRVTLELGYEHLWVDRYCIVQTGNEAIKNTQMRNMHHVFSNADVTLVAAAGKDASTGLPGAPGRPRPFQQPSALVQGHALVCIPPDPSFHIRSASAWSTRGWTYQEGLLARRRLYFSEFEMSYECRDMLAREAIRLPTSKEKKMTKSGHKRRLMEPFWLYQPFKPVGLERGSNSGGFFDLLHEYSGRQLSLSSDTLNAMLGILQLLAEPNEGEPLYHVCGVPILSITGRSSLGISSANADEVALDGFINGLCWTLEKPARRRPGFPSWSWTGWQGVVSRMLWFPGVHQAYGFDLDVSIGPRDQDGPLVPWNRYYEQLRTADESSKDLWAGQFHILEITASAVTVRFHGCRSLGGILQGTVCVGDYVWQGDFSPTRKDDDNSAGDNDCDDNDNGTFSPHSTLLQKPWTGIVLGNPRPIISTWETYIIVVKEQQKQHSSGAEVHKYWERIGLLKLEDCTLKKGMVEQRTWRLI